jgi:hypothetical protein
MEFGESLEHHQGTSLVGGHLHTSEVGSAPWLGRTNAQPEIFVRARANSIATELFSDFFHRGKLAGFKYVPLWIWGREVHGSSANDDGFSMVVNITRWSFSQTISLLGNVEQDKGDELLL